MMQIDEILKLAGESRASDLHLIVGVPPLFRIDGELRPAEGLPVMKREDIDHLFNQVAPERQQEIFSKEWSVRSILPIPCRMVGGVGATPAGSRAPSALPYACCRSAYRQ